jgi:hypothetical protein
MQANQPPNDEHTEISVENFEIVGPQLLECMGNLLRDSSVRQIRIKAPGGQLLFEAAQDRGLWGDGIMGLGPPWPGILGAVAAMVARMTIEVTRVGASPGEGIATLRGEGNGHPPN